MLKLTLFTILLFAAYLSDATAWGNGILYPSGFITCGDCPKAKLEAFSTRAKFSHKAKYLPIDGKLDSVVVNYGYVEIPKKQEIYVWR